jgi:hypothetical protein
MGVTPEDIRRKGLDMLLEAPQTIVSVDLEADGVAGMGSMLQLAAKSITGEEFYAPSIKPHFDHFIPGHREFNDAHGLEYTRLVATGRPAEEVMGEFHEWAAKLEKDFKKPLVLNGVNAGYDHAILDLYFKTFGYENPFGPAAFDTKSLALIFSANWDWDSTKKSRMPSVLKPQAEFTHDALEDVRYQDQLLLGIVGVLSDLRVRASVQDVLGGITNPT